MNNAVFITVRLKSTRLSKKVLLNVNGQPILKYLTDRIHENFSGKIVLCTSINSEDDPIVNFAINEELLFYRGSENDVLDRYYKTCVKFSIDKFYIIYGDEPFTDIDTMNENFEMLDENLPMWIKNDSLPEGTYGYGMTFKGIEYLNTNKMAVDLEVWQLMASKMSLKKIEKKAELKDSYENIRLTIDYEDDLKVFEIIINKIGKLYKTISLGELVKIYKEEGLYKINGFRIEEYKARIIQQGTI